MTDINTLPEPYRQALGCFEGFRRLGFKSDDIYFMINGPLKQLNDRTQILVILRAQGKEFSVTCGIVDGTGDEIKETWQAAAKVVNNDIVGQADLDKIWQECLLQSSIMGLLAALQHKGFLIPKLVN